MSNSSATLEKIISLCKQRGFVFQSSEIYGGVNGLYDFGPMGTAVKNNLKTLWVEEMQRYPESFHLIDGAILAHPKIWEASGHVDNFSDPMVDCLNCKKRFRADEIDLEKGCSSCGIKNWTETREFKLMFQTHLGAMADSSSIAYLRPETAQTVFVNFKNVMTTSRAKIPFGIGQIGKAFRNEITPKQFLFRVREFEQMELEFFCHPDDSDKLFDVWIERRRNFYKMLGISEDKLRFYQTPKDDLAHYSKKGTDVEYNFPFGWKELEGIAHRADFDLKNHQKKSGKDLSVFDDTTSTKYIPHVIECSVGVDRLFFTALFDAYCEEEVEGEKRIVLKLHPKLSPITVAILPLVKKLNEKSLPIFAQLKKAGFVVEHDESGSIGKRYRRHDEIGTPFCITIDFQSLEDDTVTIRFRDDLRQERIAISDLEKTIKNNMI